MQIVSLTSTCWIGEVQVHFPVSYHEPKKRERIPPTVERDVLKACQLIWWRLRGYANDYEESGRASRTIHARLERKGWLGLTVSDYNTRELREIHAWARANKDRVYVSRQDRADGDYRLNELIGEYTNCGISIWVATFSLMTKLINLLESFPKRNEAFLIKDLNKIRPFIKGNNYFVLKGSMTNAVAIAEDMNEVDRMLLRLAI